MINDDDPNKLLGQSKEQYAKFLVSHDNDVLAEAGELLWESLKAHVMQIASIKVSNLKTLTKAASEMGETYSTLFFHCYHFHSWYLGVGVPNSIIAEKKLYLESVKLLEKTMNENGHTQRARKRRLEKVS
jgi:hypothetical protein